MMDSPRWNSGIEMSKFYCQCQCLSVVTEKPVFVIPTGHVYEKGHLEGGVIRSSLMENILEAFRTGQWGNVLTFQTRNPNYIASRAFTLGDIVTNTRYRDIYNRATTTETSKTLEELSVYNEPKFGGSESSDQAFAPVEVALKYQRIQNEQQAESWKGKTWYQLRSAFQDLENDIKHGRGDETKYQQDKQELEEQENAWSREIRESLGNLYSKAYGPKQWGRFECMIFLIRCVYHGAMAGAFYYVTEFLKWGNFVSYQNVTWYHEHEVGGRLAELFLQNHGMHYNYRRPETLENRIWSWVIRENRQTAEW
jgi:hypothetical protein